MARAMTAGMIGQTTKAAMARIRATMAVPSVLADAAPV
jgi:hypothetical protein